MSIYLTLFQDQQANAQLIANLASLAIEPPSSVRNAQKGVLTAQLMFSVIRPFVLHVSHLLN